MIKPKSETEPRIEYLARVLHAFMDKHGVAAELTIDYDETTCDGYCLAIDFLSELGIDPEDA